MIDEHIPRLLARTIAWHLAKAPVVVLTGARQTGKSTLVRHLLPGPARTYLSLDDLEVLEQAQRQPDALLRSDQPITLDEVQRAPEILLAVKRAVDRKRTPGRFLLTGSANLLLMRRVSETLAGRAQYLTLWPLTRRERARAGQGAGPWGDLLDAEPDDWPKILKAAVLPGDWQPLVRRGGYPVAALEPDDQARRAWFDGYVKTYLERDLQDLSAVSSLVDFRRLMRLAALRTGQLLNQAELARDGGLSPATAHRWLNLLEASYQVVPLPGYAVNRSKRLIKAPKLYWTDAGLALHLGGEPEPSGPHLETVILSDLLQWRESEPRKPEILFWRTAAGAEVDFVLERDGRLLPIEVKTADRVGPSDARGLNLFLEDYDRRTPAALLLYDGPDIRWVADRVLAAPWYSAV